MAATAFSAAATERGSYGQGALTRCSSEFLELLSARLLRQRMSLFLWHLFDFAFSVDRRFAPATDTRRDFRLGVAITLAASMITRTAPGRDALSQPELMRITCASSSMI